MKRDYTSRELKKIGVKGGIKNKVKVMDKQAIPGAPKTGKKNRVVTLVSVTDQIVADRATGMSQIELAEKYGTSRGYIANALSAVYLKKQAGMEILKSNLLENAVACARHTQAKIEELTPMQSAVATGIFTSRLVELDKHTQSQSAEIDFSQIQSIGEDLKGLKDLISGGSEGEIIDV